MAGGPIAVRGEREGGLSRIAHRRGYNAQGAWLMAQDTTPGLCHAPYAIRHMPRLGDLCGSLVRASGLCWARLRPRRLIGDDPFAQRVGGGLDAVLEVELGEDVLQVVLHRALAYAQGICDVLVGTALGEKP